MRPILRFHVNWLYRWHVFTAIGGYNAVAIIDLTTAGEVHKDPTGDLAWPLSTASRFLNSGKKLKGKE